MSGRTVSQMKKELNFEEAMEKLEDAVNTLEGGKLTLDKAIGVYEEAVALIKICHEKLETAKQRVRILTEGADGTVSDRDFISDDET